MRLRNIPGAKEEVPKHPWCVQEEDLVGRWGEVFGNGNPLQLEIGMGKGQFVMEMARLHPQINYLGIEMYSSVLLRALQKREAYEAQQGEHLKNLFFRRMDARLLPQTFAPGEVDRIYLNFSDPWPKGRYRSRRLPSREFLQRYERVLKPLGEVEFKTDNQALFDFALSQSKEQGWEILFVTWDLHGDLLREPDNPFIAGNVMTEYEEKFSALGNPICKLVQRRPKGEEPLQGKSVGIVDF